MPIATNTAKQWDELLGHKAYFDNVNSFEYIIETTLKGKLSPQQKGLYVEAPIISINKDCTEIELSNANALSDRVKRMMKWMIETTQPPPSAPKKKHKMVAVTPGTSIPIDRTHTRAAACFSVNDACFYD